MTGPPVVPDTAAVSEATDQEMADAEYLPPAAYPSEKARQLVSDLLEWLGHGARHDKQMAALLSYMGGIELQQHVLTKVAKNRADEVSRLRGSLAAANERIAELEKDRFE